MKTARFAVAGRESFERTKYILPPKGPSTSVASRGFEPEVEVLSGEGFSIVRPRKTSVFPTMLQPSHQRTPEKIEAKMAGNVRKGSEARAAPQQW